MKPYAGQPPLLSFGLLIMSRQLPNNTHPARLFEAMTLVWSQFLGVTGN